ncbi:Scr1 family TA system antitoxin-like transcriptional regulator [Streptomyces sp. NPDC057638]|uniref:helix-turn-helix domain-containing protein n=1 Tax=Streptomyces sp. NPDC057638 TaxID=3346190 RepID=UPI00368ED984
MVHKKELSPDRSPHAAFGAQLRRERDERGWTQDELGARMGYSGRHVSAVEVARKVPTLPFSRAADVALGLTGRDRSFERAWNGLTRGVLLEGFPEYLGLERRAVEIRLFEVGLVPGPLQTREYAQALADSAVRRGVITPEQAIERVDLLMERQAALQRTPPPLIFAVLDESCVLRPIGAPEVMRAQLERLLEFAAQPNTALQIAPFSMGAGRPFDRAVNLLTLPDRTIVSYVESQTQGHLDRELASVVPLMRSYHQLQTEAASQAESVAMIEQLRKGIQ